MIEITSKATLKNGEIVDFSIIRAPEQDWAPVVMKLIGHKGELWNWQNEQTIKQSLGIDVCYYVLHRGREGFSNVTTCELNGVGSFGHVFTLPDDRRKGACAVIMERQMEHFRARGGKFLTLATGFGTPPYEIYRKFGFQGFEDKNGHMYYSTGSREAFLEDYFAPCRAVIEPVSWKHWPTAPVLFLSDAPGVIRMAAERVFGRVSTEAPLLHLLRDRFKPNGITRSQVLVNPDSGAVLGVAAWGWDKLWTGTLILDVFCHPNFWDRAPELLNALALAEEDERHLAYCDAHCPQKRVALEAVGFKAVTTLPQWQRINWASDDRVDVTLMERRRPVSHRFSETVR